MRRLIALVILLAHPAQAQDWNDYEQILAQNADRMTQETDSAGMLVRKLTLDPQITITCTGPEGAAVCEGRELAGLVPIGCAMQLSSEISAIMHKCEAFGSTAERATVATIFERTGTYVAAQTVPAQDWSALRPLAEAAADLTVQGQSCDVYMDPDGSWLVLLRAVVNAETQERLRKSLLVPRLPVASRC